MSPTLQTHIQGVHTCTHQTETQRDSQRKPCITDVIWQATFWFYSFGHETVSSGKKETDTHLYLIPYTTLQLWRGQAEPQPLNISWRNVRMAKTKMWKVQTSRYKQCDRQEFHFGNKNEKQKGSRIWDRKRERAHPAHKLGGTKLHFLTRWQVINEKNRRKYDNMTEHKRSSCCGWTQR